MGWWRMINQVVNKLKSIIIRGNLMSVDDTNARQRCGATLLAGESHDSIERIQSFGFSSVPPAGASAIFSAVAADRTRLVCLGENHLSHRPKNNKVGETIIYDAFTQFIHLKATGVIEISATGDLLITAPGRVLITSPVVEMTGDLKVKGDIIDRYESNSRTSNNMREIFDLHTHHENDANGETNPPTQKMGGGV
ncbi:MAG: hypothetical protein CMP22_07330 [Rickettsiales bacterium]|nr:hypothetical protein [Rickettsiales bacterium]